MIFACLCICSTAVFAGGEGKLLGTGGLSSIDGAAGGGLVPWAVIGGHGSEGEWDVSASLSHVASDDFDLRVASVAVGWGDRMELSAARLSLGLDALLFMRDRPEVRVETDVISAKLRLGGDLLYGDWPQVSVGMQWRNSRDRHLVTELGADDTSGVDLYLAASRLWLDGIAGRRTLANLTVRSSASHQLGLLGFSNARSIRTEGSLAVFVSRTIAIGAEYKSKPDALAFASEDEWKDLFIAWFPNKDWHFAVAYVDLGSIGGIDDQTGYYFSVQGSP